MPFPLFGEACALGAALCWAVSMILLKKSGEGVPPFALNLFKNIAALTLIVATLPLIPEGLETLSRFSRDDLYILLLSGLLGIAVADTLFLYSLNQLGVGLVSVVECLYSPFVLLFSFAVLSEQLVAAHYVGTALVLAGVLISSRHDPLPGTTRRQFLVGMFFGALSMVLMTFGIVIAKPLLEHYDFPVIWASAIRLGAGTVALSLLAVCSPSRRQHWSTFKPSPVWKVSLPGAILGTYVAMILWTSGFKYAPASIAGILNQTSVIFAIVLATLLLKEPFSRRKLLAISLASTGVLIVTLR